MACTAGLCTAEKIFLFINVAFAMYAGALLATGARLAWDPSTYTWFRFLCATQYRVTCGYVPAAGAALLALVYLAAAAQGGGRARTCLRAYAAGVGALAASEVAYAAWMGASLAAWWRHSPRAELARRGADLLHDLRPALLALDRYRDLAQPVLDMLDEVEREAPNNVFVIIVFGVVALVLQVCAFVLAQRLARTHERAASAASMAGGEDADKAADCEHDAPALGWRGAANLRMYTILDKII